MSGIALRMGATRLVDAQHSAGWAVLSVPGPSRGGESHRGSLSGGFEPELIVLGVHAVQAASGVEIAAAGANPFLACSDGQQCRDCLCPVPALNVLSIRRYGQGQQNGGHRYDHQQLEQRKATPRPFQHKPGTLDGENAHLNRRQATDPQGVSRLNCAQKSAVPAVAGKDPAV